MTSVILGSRHSEVTPSLPRGACDCHVHVFGRAGEYPFAESRVFMPSPATADDLLAFHRVLGVDRAVVVQASPQGTDNRCLVDTLAVLNARGHASRGVAVVDDDASDAELQALHAAGVRGVRMNLQSFGISSPAQALQRFRATAAVARRMGWHVQVYTPLDVLQSLADTIVQLDVPVVVDHFGLAHATGGVDQPGFDVLLNLVRHHTVYVKLSAPFRIADPTAGESGRDIARALIDCRIDRMVWGTDWPHTHQPPGVPRQRDVPEPLAIIDDGEQTNLFTSWTTPAERQRILVDNAARLYDFPSVADPVVSTPGVLAR